MPPDQIESRYGVVELDVIDGVEQIPCQSIDLRSEIDPSIQDESALMPSGTVRSALFRSMNGQPPVGEIRTLIMGADVRIVRDLTGRPGLVELSMHMVKSILGDAEYSKQWRDFLGAWTPPR